MFEFKRSYLDNLIQSIHQLLVFCTIYIYILVLILLQIAVYLWLYAVYTLCTMHNEILKSMTHCCLLVFRHCVTCFQTLCYLFSDIVLLVFRHCVTCFQTLCYLFSDIVLLVFRHCVTCFQTLCYLFSDIVLLVFRHCVTCFQTLCYLFSDIVLLVFRHCVLWRKFTSEIYWQCSCKYNMTTTTTCNLPLLSTALLKHFRKT